MKKQALKFIKDCVRTGLCTDITDYSFTETQIFLMDNNIEIIYYSVGTYGINGIIVQNQDGNLYTVTKRNSVLFQIA